MRKENNPTLFILKIALIRQTKKFKAKSFGSQNLLPISKDYIYVVFLFPCYQSELDRLSSLGNLFYFSDILYFAKYTVTCN